MALNALPPVPFELCHGGEWVISGYVHPGRKPSGRALRDPHEVEWGTVISEERDLPPRPFAEWLAALEANPRRRDALEAELRDEAIDRVREHLPRDLPFEPEWDDDERGG